MAKKTATKSAPTETPKQRTATFPIKPRGDRVIVEVAMTASRTPGGIVLPDSAQEKSQIGTIVAVGPGTPEIPMDLVIGQKVIVHTFAGSPVEENKSLGIAGDKYTIMRAEDVIGTI